MNLFVARLNSSTTGDDLLNLFSVHGEVSSAKVIMDRETGNSKCFGFVEMPNEEEANAAIAALNDTELDGNTIVVKEANPPQERPRRDFNRGGGGFNRGGGGFNRGGGERRERTFRSDDRRGGGERRGGNFRNDDRRGNGGSSRGGFDRRGGGGGFNRDFEERW